MNGVCVCESVSACVHAYVHVYIQYVYLHMYIRMCGVDQVCLRLLYIMYHMHVYTGKESSKMP